MLNLQENKINCDVMQRARSLFMKRTRTLYRWMYPDITQKQLNELVNARCQNLNDTDKQVYKHDTLGELGAGLNPQVFEQVHLPSCQDADIGRSRTKRKRKDATESNKKQRLTLLSDPDVVEEETTLLREMRDAELQEEKNFVGEMENFLSDIPWNNNEDDFLSKTLDPEHLFSFI
jgi:hypothetical protein